MHLWEHIGGVFLYNKKEDGLAADWHPTVATHIKAAKKVYRKI